MLLIDIGTAVADIREFRVESGVTVIRMPAEEFGGEYRQTSPSYLLVLWLVSIWAMVTNLAQIFFIKIFKKRRDSLKKILWRMGRDKNHVSSAFFDRFSRYNHTIKYAAASWRALDIFYNYHRNIVPQLKRDLEGQLTNHWAAKMENRQAVTNRFKIVTKLLSSAISRFRHEDEIRILSIASGSAQAVIIAMKENPNLRVKAILLDTDKTALKEAERMATEFGLQDRFKFVRGSSAMLEEVCENFCPHIVEMVGFLDYLSDDQAGELIGRIKKILAPNGFLLACNINKNPEKIFLDWTLLWPMIYRNEEQFSNVLIHGGFSPENTEIIYEPFRIHGIAVCRNF